MRDIYLRAKGRTVIWRGDMLDLIYHNRRQLPTSVVKSADVHRQVHYKTNSRIIRRIIRFGLVVEYHPDYQVNYQPDYRPGKYRSTRLACAAASRPDATRRPFECYTFTYMSLATAQQGAR